jgi:hypothetical protein
MIFSKGFVYRWGVRIKNFGECMALVKVFGIPILRWCCRPVVDLGLGIRNSVMNSPAAEFSRKK